MADGYQQDAPLRADLDATPGPLVLEFGDNNCGICAAARPAIDQALAERPEVRHLKIADGRGRPLGRSFGVKLWPTLVFLQDGREVARLVRPTQTQAIAHTLQLLQ
ncbi:MAG: thioredoxin family protein [Ferruginibacter sp.]|nr:thioredoxin family protein [Rhodoferax sp.]